MKIITEHVLPPIPLRDYDWCATLDGWEPGDVVGSGRTEREAIDDLLDKIEEGEVESAEVCGCLGPSHRNECKYWTLPL